jgi:hypothetical protein
MNLRLGSAALASALVLATPAAAVAPGVNLGSAQFTIGLSGFVPVICRASVDATVVAPSSGTVQLGALNEFCNSPNGYVVVADYSASLGNATLLVDGKAVPLAAAGNTIVTQSSTAAISTHTLALEGASAGSLSFRIEPR